MSVIVGVSINHNSTVCVYKDGEIIFCQSEERLNGVKNSIGFPEKTIEYIYNNVINEGSVDKFVIHSQYNAGLFFYLMNMRFKPHSPNIVYDNNSVKSDSEMKPYYNYQYCVERMSDSYKEMLSMENSLALNVELRRYCEKIFRVGSEKIAMIHHHIGHIFSFVPFIGSNSDGILALSLDGAGDCMSAMVCAINNNEFKILSKTNDYCSVGWLYSAVTMFLGMKVGEHEYKVMGLAPYSKPEHYQSIIKKFQEILWVDDDGEWRTSAPVRDFFTYRVHEVVRYERFDNVAGAVQSYIEQEVVKWVKIWLKKTGLKSLACSGGVFMNVKINKLLSELDQVDEITITPSSGDESATFGVIMASLFQENNALPQCRVNNLYLGEDIDNENVERAILENPYNGDWLISRPEDADYEIAEFLAEGHIVARCRGRAEFGARALGNRSILADPSRPESVMFINEAIKNRDFWMPFAPSILADQADKYLINPRNRYSPFMMIGFDTTELGRRHLAAAMHHYDFTVRPQFVTKENSYDYHRMIRRFSEITGIYGILNTSFNIHGEPIVGSPEAALSAFQRSGLQILLLGDFIIRKRP